ncbi:MAG: metal ABC transporter permease [Phycisphaerales bacterium]|nr:metal ABC transporter permease [Phycisphaerales bacterium]
MSDLAYGFIALDLMPMLAGVLAALCCGLLGNHLVLRQQSLMGDAISHAVLPGLVLAFLVGGTINPAYMFLGAGASAIVTVVLIQLVRRLGRVEPGAAMGVIFSVLFALGVFLLEQGNARAVDLDASCVLYGNLESLSLHWTPADTWDAFLSKATLEQIPRQIWTLLGMTGASIVFMVLFFKELRISAFDPGISTAQGINASAIQFLLMVFVAAAAVASFEAVGSILVIAMLICPAATARLLTDRMGSQILVSALAALGASVGGYFLSANAPESLVHGGSVNAAGMMAVIGGVLLVLTIIASPRHGIVARAVHRQKLSRRIAMEDLLTTLYRAREAGAPHHASGMPAVARAKSSGLVTAKNGALSLTERGLADASAIIRRHRLWEGYLVDRAGLLPDHVHAVAETLEHLDSPSPNETDAPHGDQHGKPIPPAS